MEFKMVSFGSSSPILSTFKSYYKDFKKILSYEISPKNRWFHHILIILIHIHISICLYTRS